MNRLSCLHIGALILAIGAAGCFASTTSDETGSKRDRESAPQLVTTGASDGNGGETLPAVVHSHTDPASEAMGPQPDPWSGRAHTDNGGPQPDPWGQSEGDESNGTIGPRPNPNPTR